MSVELVIDRTKPLDEIWEEVSVFYKRAYKIEWKVRPSEDKIYWLYGEMRKFCRSINVYHHENQSMRDRALRFHGLLSADDPTRKREPHE